MSKNSNREYAIALYNATKDVKGKALEGVINNFIQVLFRDQKLKKVYAIISEFELFAKKQQGIVSIDITSARELDKNTLATIKKSFGSDVEATTVVDPRLLGGIIVQEESTIFDGSLKTQLQKLKQSLI